MMGIILSNHILHSVGLPLRQASDRPREADRQMVSATSTPSPVDGRPVALLPPQSIPMLARM